MRPLLIICLIFIASLCFANQQLKYKTDSLLCLIDNSSGKEKVGLLLKAAELNLSANNTLCYELLNDAIAITKDLDLKREAVDAFSLLGKLYQSQGKYEKAVEIFMISLQASENIEHPEGVADAYNNIGIAWYYFSKFDKALEAYQNALKIFEKYKLNTKIVKALNNIGVVYDELGNYPSAMTYYRLALELNQKQKDKKGIAVSYNNLGNCYYYEGDVDNAIEYFQKSLSIKHELGDVKGQANTYFNIGRIYYENEKYNLALKFYDKCREIETRNKFADGLTNTYLYIGYTYSKIGDTKRALDFFNKSLVIADSMNLATAQKNCYSALGDLYYTLGKYEQAFDYFREFQKKKDELFDEEKHKQIAELETKYQVDKKEQEIKLYESDIKRQKLVIFVAVGGILVLAVFLVNLFYQIIQKKKINYKLSRYNREIEGQKREITSSIEYARRIQSAILPEDKFIDSLLPEHFIIYKPKDIVSGDFYWVDHLKTGETETVYVAAVDCTGHGVPGAFMSMIGNILLNEIFNEKQIYTTSAILNELNYLVRHSLKQETLRTDNLDGMDIAICAINRKSNMLSYSGANRDLYILRNGELIVLDADKAPIGGITAEDYNFKQQEFQLISGDMVYLFSDGYVDQFGGEKGKKFLTKNFKTLLKEIYSLPVTAQKEKLETVLTQWMSSYQQVDDILVIGFRV